jgi:hypothetical protein
MVSRSGNLSNVSNRARGGKGDLSRAVEEAVQARILELTADKAKRRNARYSSDTITAAIDEALERARRC